MTGDRTTLGATFDQAAELYDEARPGYPEDLFGDVICLSGIPPRGRILEIGAGTGKATLPFARRGYRVTCLEPGPNLAAVLRRNVARYSAVQIVNRRFEDWAVEPGGFDLVIAATSFQWAGPDVRYVKTAEALKSGGCAAIFANAHVPSPGEDNFFVRVQDIYRRHTSEMVWEPTRLPELPDEIDPAFLATGAFEPVAVKHYPWTQTYDTAGYLTLLQTFSDHIALPELTLRALLADVAALIDAEFDGRVVKHVVSVLQLARRR
jgi:SAM-dependent methyltransferase